jgi:DNA-binding FadR family transcriptional regulator
VAACARSLRESIVSGELSVGASLPPERELAATFGVNRLTLRAALAQLGAAGLIAVRHGSGNVVRDYFEVGGPDLLPTLVALATDPGQWREVVEDMLRVRRALAGAVLERLVGSMTPAKLKRIEAAVERFIEVAQAPGASAEEILRADQRVGKELLREAGPVLALAANPIYRVLDELPELGTAMFAQPELNVAGYRLLISCLKDRDPEVVQNMLTLLASLDEALLDRLQKPKRKKR